MLQDALVKQWMSSPVISVRSSERIKRVHQLMKEYQIRRTPVMDDDELIGIVTIGDIREASPSDATTLSIWEMNYLWEQITVDKVMTHKPLTIRPDTTMIHAAQIMLNHKISGLPVVDSAGELVGILSESDIFRFLVESCEPVETEGLVGDVNR